MTLDNTTSETISGRIERCYQEIPDRGPGGKHFRYGLYRRDLMILEEHLYSYMRSVKMTDIEVSAMHTGFMGAFKLYLCEWFSYRDRKKLVRALERITDKSQAPEQFSF